MRKHLPVAYRFSGEGGFFLNLVVTVLTLIGDSSFTTLGVSVFHELHLRLALEKQYMSDQQHIIAAIYV
jgi:hypothetical protein